MANVGFIFLFICLLCSVEYTRSADQSKNQDNLQTPEPSTVAPSRIEKSLNDEVTNDTSKGGEDKIPGQTNNTTNSTSGDVNDATTVGSTVITENPLTETGVDTTPDLSPSMTATDIEGTDVQLTTQLDGTEESKMSEDVDTSVAPSFTEQTTMSEDVDTSVAPSFTEQTTMSENDGDASTPTLTEEGIAVSDTDVDNSVTLTAAEEESTKIDYTSVTPNDLSIRSNDDTTASSTESNLENTLASTSVPVAPTTVLQNTAETTADAFTSTPTFETTVAATAATTETKTSALTQTPTSSAAVTTSATPTSTSGTVVIPKRQPTNEDSGSNTRVAIGIAVPTLLVLSVILGFYCYKKEVYLLTEALSNVCTKQQKSRNGP